MFKYFLIVVAAVVVTAIVADVIVVVVVNFADVLAIARVLKTRNNNIPHSVVIECVIVSVVGLIPPLQQ